MVKSSTWMLAALVMYCPALLASNTELYLNPGDSMQVRNPTSRTFVKMTTIKIGPGEGVNILSTGQIVVDPPFPPPTPTPIPPGATQLPWNPTGNSRTTVYNCDPKGDFRTFYFQVPADAATAHAISGSELPPGIGNMRNLTLKELPDGAAIAHQYSTGIQFTFSFTPKFGYTTIKKGYTYLLEVKSDPTPGYNCSYYIDLNNTN